MLPAVPQGGQLQQETRVSRNDGFAAKYLRYHATHVRQAVGIGIGDRMHPRQSPSLEYGWMARISLHGQTSTLEVGKSLLSRLNSSCYDCDTELNLAVEMVAPVFLRFR